VTSRHPHDSERGVALLVALVAMSVMSMLGLGLLLSSTVDRLAATNHDDGLALANFAESGLELAARELATVADWNALLAGTIQSSLTDGPPAGVRQPLPGILVDLSRLTNELRCGRALPCSAAVIAAATAERPWGANNPHWQPFLYTTVVADTPRRTSSAYVVVWIGDDGSEADADPLSDGGGPGGEGRYIVRAHAEAFSSSGGRHAIEAELARVCRADETCLPGIRVQSWRVVTGAMP
jgi:hypothetical protein